MQAQDPAPTVELAVQVLRDLLEYSGQLSDVARDIGTNHIPGLLTSLLALKPECQISALEGTKACMAFYPRACGSLRGKLATYFLAHVDAETPQLQQLACDCYALLPSLGAGFTQGLKYRECWEQQVHSLLATLHSLLGILYEGAETEHLHYEGPGIEIPLPAPEEGETTFLLHLKLRFTGLARCLCRMLSNEFPAPVTVPVQDILDLVCRTFNVSTKNIGWFGDGPLRMLFLPSIHLEILDLLSALILACGPRMVRFGGILCRLFPQVLTTWSAGRDLLLPGQERPYSAVRTRVYQVLDLWIQVAGAASGILQGHKPHNESLLGHWIADISPPTETLKLQEGCPGSDGKPSAPKRPRLSDLGNSGAVHRKQDPQANSDVCLAALQGLSRAVLLSGSLLKEQAHKRLQELVIRLLIRLIQAEPLPGSPYASASCRRELYRLLLALVLAPAPSCPPPPLHCALRLLSQGRGDANLQVSSFCAEALVVCNALLHPRLPSLQLPLVGPSGPPPSSSEISPATASPFGPTTPLPFPAARFPSAASPSAPSSVAASANSMGLPLPSLSLGQLPPRLTPEEPALPPSPGTAEAAAGAKMRRPVFIHYDKEEEEDLELSLESDSDDSVVIMPKGQLGRMVSRHSSAAAPAPAPLVAAAPAPPAPPAAPPALPASPPPPPPPPPAVAEEGLPEPAVALALGPPALAAPLVLPPPPAPAASDISLPALVEEEPPTVININSSEEEEEDEEEDFPEDEFFDEEEEEFDEEDEEEEEYEGELDEEGEEGEFDEELEELSEEDEEEFDEEEEEGLTEEEEEEEEGLTEEEEEEGLLPTLPPRKDDEPPELLPAKEEPPQLVEEEEEGAGLLMEVDEEAFHPPEEALAMKTEEAVLPPGEALPGPPLLLPGALTLPPPSTGEAPPPLVAAPVEQEQKAGEEQTCRVEGGAAAVASPGAETAVAEEEEEEEAHKGNDAGEAEEGPSEARVPQGGSEMRPPSEEEVVEVKDEAPTTDETDAMLAAFVDCPPDEEKAPLESSP